MEDMNKVLCGDVLEKLKEIESETIQCAVTSPPYWGLRDYGVDGQLGQENTPEEYVAKMVEVFHEVMRVLRSDGTLWINLGDCYANASGSGKQGMTGQRADRDFTADTIKSKVIPRGSGRWGGGNNQAPGLKHKDLVGIPWRVALALQADGWYLRQDIIWAKPNPMPESVTDRCTKSHEYLFLLSKSPRYYFDSKAVKEPATSKKGRGAIGRGKQESAQASTSSPQQDHSGWLGGDGVSRNRRSVWSISTHPYKGAHFAVFPEALVEPCVKAGSKEGDIVLDPFAGSGTTLAVAKRLGRNYLGIEINEKYLSLIEKRLKP